MRLIRIGSLGHPVCRKRPGSLVQSGGPLLLRRAFARRAFSRSQVRLLEHRRFRILDGKRSGRHLHAHAVLVGQFRWYPPRVPAGETSAIFKVACGDNLAVRVGDGDARPAGPAAVDEQIVDHLSVRPHDRQREIGRAGARPSPRTRGLYGGPNFKTVVSSARTATFSPLVVPWAAIIASANGSSTGATADPADGSPGESTPNMPASSDQPAAGFSAEPSFFCSRFWSLPGSFFSPAAFVFSSRFFGRCFALGTWIV